MRVYRLDSSTQRMKISLYLRQVQGYSGRSLRSIKVFLDGKQVKTTKKLPSRGILKVLEKEKGTNIEPIKMDLDIAFEDDDILVVNKPYGIITHPTLKKVDMTLANGIVYHINTVPRFYNRLDMDTTGLIVVAKNAYTQSFLQNFGDVNKKYLAVVEGKLEKEEIVVEEKIFRVENELARVIDEKGQEAKTKIKAIKYFEKSNVSLIECELYTGRTHQIRVHTKHIGHPIIGDKLYNPNSEFKCRQMLHAYKLSFIHPRTKKRIDIEIKPYKDMIEWS
ncbi:RluA family pseudouridine synthase [Oceanivirga salmonicida]|uniref:RluA family pseudouridine synthase n=1 Tax=Oceanivirga salmonicida TaxID=1769291 RepID=UPI00083516B2|nr:RluA family pseudouridine synthase [Oceanivirga salmonicida]